MDFPIRIANWNVCMTIQSINELSLVKMLVWDDRFSFSCNTLSFAPFSRKTYSLNIIQESRKVEIKCKANGIIYENHFQTALDIGTGHIKC